MALIMEIMKTIAQPVAELAKWLEETYQVDINDTTAKWRELTGMNITVNEDDEEVQSVDVDVTSSTKKANKKIPKTKDVCQHIFLSGKKVGDQCTTKPKGGAAYCSAHKPKDSAKSAKSNKAPKKREVEQIEPEFESEPEKEEKPAPKKPSKKNKEEKTKTQKKTKKPSENLDFAPTRGHSPLDEDGHAHPKALRDPDSDIEALSDLEAPVKPLLKKKSVVKPAKKAYHTDDEQLDDDLDLSD